jgi:carboxylate-amine ligase
VSVEAEVRTGRCESFAEAVVRLGERRAQLAEAADRLGIALAATGTHPWTPWQDVHLIDTPHYRRVADELQYVAWRNQTFVLHLHVGVRGADRALRLCTAFRSFLPELLALSASSPFAENVRTGLHSTRSQIFTRSFPRCGVPDVFAGWADYDRYVRFLYRTGSIVEHTQIWWSVRPHLAFPTVEIRICDGQPTLAEAQALSAFIYGLSARLLRAIDEGEPLPDLPHRLIEENLWRAIRYGLSGQLIDLATGEVRPARARLEALAEWIAPVADELGAAQYLAVPQQNAAERQIARFEEGLTLREIYAAEVVTREAVHG